MLTDTIHNFTYDIFRFKSIKATPKFEFRNGQEPEINDNKIQYCFHSGCWMK